MVNAPLHRFLFLFIPNLGADPALSAVLALQRHDLQIVPGSRQYGHRSASLGILGILPLLLETNRQGPSICWRNADRGVFV